MLAMEKNTWYFLSNNSVEQMLYCLKRINDPCREHVGNNFQPASPEFAESFTNIQEQISDLFKQTETILSPIEIDEEKVKDIRQKAEFLQDDLSEYRKQVIDSIQGNTVNIESTVIYISIIQESQQMLSCLRHMLRGVTKFCA